MNHKSKSFGLFLLAVSLVAVAFAAAPVRAEQVLPPSPGLVNHTDGQWIKDDLGWWYRYPDGNYPKDELVFINKQYYFFDERGYMYTGWKYLPRQYADGIHYWWFYFDPEDGHQVEGWKQIDSKWYHFTPGGFMSSNAWQLQYYLTESGEMAHDQTLLIRGYYYTFDANGLVTDIRKAE